jgi:alanine dehydrogenase
LDEEYRATGTRLVADAAAIWRGSEVIATVFGPVPEEYDHLREGLIVLAFLSLRVHRRLLQALLESRYTALSMETEIAGYGLLDALHSHAGLMARGLTVAEGRMVSDALAREYAIDHHPLQSILPLHAEGR